MDIPEHTNIGVYSAFGKTELEIIFNGGTDMGFILAAVFCFLLNVDYEIQQNKRNGNR